MPSFAVVVEGFGDVPSVPILIGRIGGVFGIAAYASMPAIRSKGLTQLKRPGELERWILLAQSRGADATLFVVDADDDCPSALSGNFRARVTAMGGAVRAPVHFCFIEREFEAWFLVDAEGLRKELPGYGWIDNVQIANPSAIRGAKEALDRLFDSVSYKESRDQEVMSRKIDVKNLYLNDRSFRKLVRSVTSLEYHDLSFILS